MKTVLIPKTKFSEYLDTIFLFGIYALAFLIPLFNKASTDCSWYMY